MFQFRSWKNLSLLSAIAFLSLLGLTGCFSAPPSDSPTNNTSQNSSTSYLPDQSSNTSEKAPFHLYLIFTPLDDTQLELAQNFLSKAKRDTGSDQTKIFLEGNNYTIFLLCNDDVLSITPNLKMETNTKVDAVTSLIDSELTKFPKNQQSCQSKPSSLMKVAAHLSDATKHKENGKLIVFLQAPWTKEQIQEQPELIDRLKTSMKDLEATKQVEQILLFGISSDGAGYISSAFTAFNQNGNSQFESANQTIEQSQELLKKIRTNYLN